MCKYCENISEARSDYVEFLNNGDCCIGYDIDCDVFCLYLGAHFVAEITYCPWCRRELKATEKEIKTIKMQPSKVETKTALELRVEKLEEQLPLHSDRIDRLGVTCLKLVEELERTGHIQPMVRDLIRGMLQY